MGGANPWVGENANESQGVTTAQEFAPAEVSEWFEAFPTNKVFNEFQEERTTDGNYDPRMDASLAWNYPGHFLQSSISEFELQFGFHSMIKNHQNYMFDNEGISIS